MLTVLITIIHIFACMFIIIVVLLQSGQSADIAAAFGGAGSQTAFGPRGATTVLSKATTVAAIVFMLTSISLSVFASRASHATGSILNGAKTSTTKPATNPATQPATNPATPTPQQK
jgi:preprotein translocase subunit SecG